MTIDRVFGPAIGRSLVSSYDGLVYAVSYDPHAAPGIAIQTQNALDFLDENLAMAGTSKEALLQATIYLQDMTMKADMDIIWNEWIGPKENWPQRACVGADLGDEITLIEIVVIAAKLEDRS